MASPTPFAGDGKQGKKRLNTWSKVSKVDDLSTYNLRSKYMYYATQGTCTYFCYSFKTI